LNAIDHNAAFTCGGFYLSFVDASLFGPLREDG